MWTNSSRDGTGKYNTANTVISLVLNEVSSSSSHRPASRSAFRSSQVCCCDGVCEVASDASVAVICSRHPTAQRVHFWVARSLAQSLNNSCDLNNLSMGSDEIFDLEKQFAFYGSFHNHPVNVAIHVCFVWPIFFTLLILLAYTDPLVPQWSAMAALPCHEYMVLNYSFIVAAVFALFYMSLEPKSGSLAAFLVLLCWMGSNAVAQHFPYATGWKVRPPTSSFNSVGFRLV